MTDPGALPLSFVSSLVTIFLIFSIIPPCLSNSTELYRSCSKQPSCGDVNIKYPFWGQGRVSECGIPGLEVTCGDKDVPFINLNSVWYRVLGINYDDQVLRIARQDFLDGYCPPEFVNTSLDPFLFENLSGFTNITFLYGCLPIASPVTFAVFNCIVSGSSLPTGYIRQGDIGPGQCYRSVYFPVSVYRVVEAIANLSAAESILSEGFEVRWKIDNRACSECVRSEGACGNNPETNKTICFCPNQAAGPSGTCSSSSSPDIAPISPGESSKTSLGIGLSIAGAAIVGIGIGCMYLYAKRLTIGRKNKNHKQIEAIIKNSDSLTPKRYSYSGIKKMTNSFKEKLGEGAFGSVYKGKLQEGDVVAVNFLSESKGDGEDFINEVASFSRTSHINIIRLLGFCYEGRKRALIYEYMYNGSLDKFIYDQRSSPHKNHLKWDKLYEIATGIARGLEYLHRGCATRIVHFDIKPHNILLDENFCPKISDFGLAKLSKTRESRVSMLHARGTIGYIAPEVYCRSIGEVSYRADVYSYGMMVLEIIGARKNINAGATETYFPDWIYEHIESVGVSKLHDIAAGTNVEDDDDQRISRMMIVGLWCIQMSPADRPSMTKVVEMLEGSLESLQVPPKPVSCSSVVRLSSPYSSTTTSQITAIIPLQHEETN